MNPPKTLCKGLKDWTSLDRDQNSNEKVLASFVSKKLGAIAKLAANRRSY